MKTSFYSIEELAEIGLKSYGNNVLISRHCCIYGANNISIGNNVRIDDFCILSGSITLGDNIHISAYCALYGAKGIEFKNNSGMSPRSTIFSAMDDFSGDYLIGPIHDKSKTNVTGGKVIIEEYVQIGAHCVVFPNLTIGKGCVIGAMGLVNKSLSEWGIYIGQPVRLLKERKRGLLNL